MIKKKEIEVVAAIIYKDNTIFATQRGYGEFQGGWEFPGGKVEENEVCEEALVREIQEELEATVKVEELFHTVNYEYPNFRLKMHCYLCSITAGKLILKEHQAGRWLTKDTIDSVEWLPADIEVKDKLKKQFYQ